MNHYICDNCSHIMADTCYVFTKHDYQTIYVCTECVENNDVFSPKLKYSEPNFCSRCYSTLPLIDNWRVEKIILGIAGHIECASLCNDCYDKNVGINFEHENEDNSKYDSQYDTNGIKFTYTSQPLPQPQVVYYDPETLKQIKAMLDTIEKNEQK